MKRRPEFHTRDLPKIRSSSVRGFNGVRSYLEARDVNSAKRVKFADPDGPPNVRSNASFPQHEVTGAPQSNAPKTSEYAFFKKSKKDAGCCRSYSLYKEDNQLKNFETSGCTREITDIFEDNVEDHRSSLLVEKERLITHNLFPSPHVIVSNNSGHNYQKQKNNNSEATCIPKNSCKDITSSLLVDKGTEYLEEDIFSRKRNKLRQWVAETSLPEVEDHCSKGNSLVSVLLSRLFPDTDERDYCRNVRPTQMRADTKCSSYAFPESDPYSEEFHWTPKESRMEVRQGRYFCHRSGEIIPSKWDTEGHESYDSLSTSHAEKYHFHYGHNKFGSDYEGEAASLITVDDPYFCSQFEKHGSTSSIHIDKLNKFQDSDESATRRGPCTLLLDWDSDKLKGDLSIVTGNADINSQFTMAALWDVDKQSLDNCFDLSELYTPSLISYHPSSFTLQSYPHSAYLHNWDTRRFLEEEKFLVAELEYFPLSLPYTPKYLNLTEDSNICNSSEGRSIVSSSQNGHWFVNEPDLEALLSAGLKWKCLSMSGSFDELHSCACDGFQSPRKEGPFSYLLTEGKQGDCLYSPKHRRTITQFAEDVSIDFQNNPDKDRDRPLLLNSSSWLSSGADIHYDDDDDDYDERIYI